MRRSSDTIVGLLEEGLQKRQAFLEVEARDEGPGIEDVELALRDGYSTGDGLGLGLPGARRLVDEFTIETRPGRGTVVRMIKWGPHRR